VWSIIKDWKNKGISIVLTTHYMDEAEILSDSIFIIDKGKVITKGNMAHLRSTLNYHTRIDIHTSKFINTSDLKDLFGSYGKFVNISSDSVRLFTFENTVKELSDTMVHKNLSFSVTPITLDDIFVNLVGDRNLD
jgi:ABC-2 type transport system ATP-binding protein